MILRDANILLYAYDSASPHHSAASRWLDEVLSSEQVYFSWHTLTAFLRISTNPRIWLHPLKNQQAIEVVASWLELENTHIVGLEKKN